MKNKKYINQLREKFSLCIGVLLAFGIFSTNANAVSFPDNSRISSTDAPNVIAFWNYDPLTFERTEKFCSGVMLDSVTFLTAAHCLLGNKYFIAVKNQNSKWERGEPLMIYDYLIHPRYSESTSQNDIAVGILNFKARNTPNIYAYTLSNQSYSTKSTYIYGWGLDQNQNDTGYLNKAKLKDYTPQAKRYFPKSFNSKTMIAAGQYDSVERVFSGACFGDSGGPLIAESSKGKSVIGITSYIQGPECDISAPTVFTRVSYYRDFIKNTRENLLAQFKAEDTVSPELDTFSLPWNTDNNLFQYGSDTSKWTTADVQTGGGTGAADIKSLQFQTWKTQPGIYPLAINVYLTKSIEPCIEKQKGSWLVQMSLSSSQKIDLQFRVSPSSGCYTPDAADFYLAKVEKTPPAAEICGNPAVKAWSTEKNNQINSFTFYIDKGCIGTANKIWIRVDHRVDGLSDIEPGVDMWAGPFLTTQPS